MNTICHIEYKVTDFDRAQTFYGGLFGWTFRSFGDEMVVFGMGDQHIGGFEKAATIQPGNSPSVWFQVQSLDEACQRAETLGGKVLQAAGPVPGVGFSAQVADLDGNPIGLVQFDS